MRSEVRKRGLCAALALVAAWLAGACTPEPPTGVFVCGNDGDCPKGQRCAPDLLCRDEAAIVPGGTLVDAQPEPTLIDGEGGAQSADAYMAPGRTQSDGGGEGDARAGGHDASLPEVGNSQSAQPDAGGASEDAATADAGSSLDARIQRPLGASCSKSEDCATAGCVDNVCCEVASCGTCQRCGASGRCDALESGSDPDSCDMQCTTGKCGLSDGELCASAASCRSGNCVDGYCCNARCDQGCRSCAVTGHEGACTAISGADDPGTCQATRTCAAAQCAAIDAQSLEIGYGNYFGTNSIAWLRLAQVVTVPNAGQLIGVQLDILCWSPQDRFTVALHGVNADGTPASTLLGTFEQDTAAKDPRTPLPAVMDHKLVTFTLSTPVRVTANSRVAIVADAPNNTQQCMLQSGRFESYAGGSGYGLNAGETAWIKISEDFTFRLLVVR